MAQTGMYMKVGHVFATWKYGDMSLRDDGLVVSRHDLAEQVTFISASGTQHLDVSLGDPRVILDNTLGKSHVDLSALPLHTLYLQKPGAM